jgi:uncharacterized protein (UPF0147 family)
MTAIRNPSTSAAGIESHTLSVPKNVGRMSSGIMRKTSVHMKARSADVLPSLSEVKKDEAK